MAGEKQKKFNYEKELLSFVKKVLRRASLMWPGRAEALNRAKVSRGVFQCAMCKEEFKKKQVHVDHINPVVSIERGFTGWDEYISRLFVKPEELQILCVQCHEIKTKLEGDARIIKKTLDKE